MPRRLQSIMCGSAQATRRVIALVAMLASASLAHAQVTPEEHASHHPEEQAAGPTSQPAEGGMGEMMGGDMGGMMEQMGAPKPRALYPSLMRLPDLPPEERDEVQRQAHARMTSGTTLMAEALQLLASAAPSDDFAAMQAATAKLREGITQFESGLAAHRALAEGKSPRNVALQWFKREMNLLPPIGAQHDAGPFGLSWFHFFVMLLLTIFAIMMICMYFFKMRRAAALIERLSSPGGGEPGATQPVPPGLGASLAARDDRVERNADAADGPSPTQRIAPEAAVELPEPTGKRSGLLRVSRVFQETSNVKTFRLVNDDNGPIPFTYLPGQFLTLTVPLDGKTVKRSYTIASSPTQRHYCEITVKRDGVVSSFLHDQVNEGDTLRAIGPSGKFTFTGAESDSIVLIGGGVGITPLMSVIRYLADVGWEKEIYLLYSCRTSADFAFRGELEHLQRRHRNLHVGATMTREPGTVWMGLLSDRFTKEVIDQSVPNIAGRRVHLCGPPPMMAAITGMLGELGVPPERIKTESFGPAQKPATTRAAPVPHEDQEELASVEFQRSNKTAPLPPDLTILDVADQVGVEIENSCRVGSCGTCVVKLLAGSVTMECEDGLDPDDKADSMVLACQAKAVANVIVDA